MSIHFHHELEKLRNQILLEGTLIEDNLSKAVRAVLDRDMDLAQTIIRGDGEVDQMEVDIEESCLKILALHQPVALDLRFIVAVLKMNNDLERMGDHTVNIAKRARFLAKREPMPWPTDLEDLAGNVRRMVRGAMDALIQSDAEKARQVCADDDIVDAQKRRMIAGLRGMLAEDRTDLRAELRDGDKSAILLKMLDVPRHLERIADLATNIAEDVIYLVEGRIIRHRHGSPEEEEN